MVIAHRAGFESTPENSKLSIQNAIDMGVDIVEIDVQMSQDGVLIVMHDETLNRTTNGTGSVSDYTLEQLKQFKLLYPNGTISNENISSLKEILSFCKGKMHVFIDKGQNYINEIYSDILETNTQNQTFVGGTLSIVNLKLIYPNVWDKINYIPRAGTGQTMAYITGFESEINPVAYFPSCDLIASNNEVFNEIVGFNKWIFTTSLAGSNCSEQILNPSNIWNWQIQRGIDGIFTDKPEELVNYLKSIGLHENQ